MARKTYTSTEVKRRWNQQHYKQCRVFVPKALGARFRERCKELDISMASVIKDIMTQYIEKNS